MTQKTRPDDSFLNFPVNTGMAPAHGDVLGYSTGTRQWTNVGGLTTGSLDGRYLLLDTSNDPLTGNLLILTTGSLPNPPLNLSQVITSGNNIVTGSTLYISRTESFGTNTYVAPYIQILGKSNQVMGGGILSYVSSIGGEKVRIDTVSTGTGVVLALFDSENVFDSVNSKLLLLKNNGTSRFYVNGSGTAYSNDVPLIKEAPTDGSFYARKNAGWEPAIPSNGWIPQLSTWTRTDNHSFTLTGNQTGTYAKGAKVWYRDNGGVDEYGTVQSSSLTGTTTYVNLIPNSDYLLSGTITNPYVSYEQSPVGYPGTFSYATIATLTNITVGNGTLTLKFTPISPSLMHVHFELALGSSSSLGNPSEFSLPVSASGYGGSFEGIGIAVYLDAGIASYSGQLGFDGYSKAYFVAFNSAGVYASQTNISATVPFVWGSGDYLQGELTYQW